MVPDFHHVLLTIGIAAIGIAAGATECIEIISITLLLIHWFYLFTTGWFYSSPHGQ